MIARDLNQHECRVLGITEHQAKSLVSAKNLVRATANVEGHAPLHEDVVTVQALKIVRTLPKAPA